MNISNRLIRMFTQENFSALSKRCIKFFALLFLFSFGASAFSEDWYISNAAGMSLEKTFSRAALREPYALKIETWQPNQIPAEIVQYVDSSIDIPESFSVELHTLYENGEEKNRRWICRYAENRPWMVLSAAETSAEEFASKGFAEYYNESGLLIQEDTFLEESIISIRYSYNDTILLRSETWQDLQLHLWSDEYRYSRAGSLRSIKRTFFSDETENTIRLTKFAPLGPYEYISVFTSVPVISSDFVSDIIHVTNTNIEYVTDDRGRVVSEIHKNEEGAITGELHNVWSGNRLASMSWNGENDSRRIEYEYDEQGNRLIERNYRDGILERLVRIEEDSEVEELYLHGQLSLRAVWKDGQKISEEYFHQNLGNRPRRIP